MFFLGCFMENSLYLKTFSIALSFFFLINKHKWLSPENPATNHFRILLMQPHTIHKSRNLPFNIYPYFKFLNL